MGKKDKSKAIPKPVEKANSVKGVNSISKDKNPKKTIESETQPASKAEIFGEKPKEVLSTKSSVSAETKKAYQRQIPRRNVDSIDSCDCLQCITHLSKLLPFDQAFTALQNRKRCNKFWSDEEWLQHIHYIGRMAAPRGDFSLCEPPNLKKKVPLNSLTDSINRLSVPKTVVPKYNQTDESMDNDRCYCRRFRPVSNRIMDLAMPKRCFMDCNFHIPESRIGRVPPDTMQYEATWRINQLSQPKYNHCHCCHSDQHVNPAVLHGIPTPRVVQLSQPKNLPYDY